MSSHIASIKQAIQDPEVGGRREAAQRGHNCSHVCLWWVRRGFGRTRPPPHMPTFAAFLRTAPAEVEWDLAKGCVVLPITAVLNSPLRSSAIASKVSW